jgi:hypothetical protein
MRSYFSLEDIYPPSPPCNCDICKSFCKRPGWWTIDQVPSAMRAGYSNKMMLEIAPDFTFAVLSPSFRGCEGYIAINEYSNNGCNFFVNEMCELHGTDLQPLECRVCHHDYLGLGPKCHLDIEKQWNSPAAQKLVIKWMEETRFLEKLSKNSNANNYKPD